MHILDLFLSVVVWMSIVGNFLLAILVYTQNRRNRIHVNFVLLALIMTFWAVAFFFFKHPLFWSSLVWMRIVYTCVLLLIGMLFLFSHIFPKSVSRPYILPLTIYVMTSLPLAYLFIYTDLLISDVVLETWGHRVVLAPLFPLFASWASFFTIWMVWNFWRNFKQATGLEKTQARYLLLGIVMLSMTAMILDGFIPVVFKTSQFFWISPAFAVFFTGFVAYAIIKHRLMDIRLVVARSVAYSLLVLVLGSLFVGTVFFATDFITKHPPHYLNMLLYTLTALLLCFLFQPLLRILEKTTNRIFYKEKYDERKLLHDLTLIMASKLRLADLTGSLLKRILTKMRISRGAFVLVEKNTITHLNRRGYPIGPRSIPRFTEEELKKLTKPSEIIIFDELPETPMKRLLRELEISVVVPLRTKTEKEDILILGEKLSGDPYTDQDIRLLEIFAPQAAITVENASTVEKLLALDEAKSEFITVASHQLRTPLSVARWNFEVLFEGSYGEVSQKASKVLHRIYESLMDLNRGLNNLMSAMEIEEGKSILKIETTDFRQEILEPAKTALKTEIEQKNIQLEEEIKIEKTIKLDKTKIRKVLEALLDNAIRYSPSGSTVSLSARLERKEGKLQLLVSVEDQGIGIEPKHEDLIFHRFFRGEEAKKMSPGGFGLSLSIARSLVKAHYGHLWLGSKKGPGSIFYFTLPLKGPKKI